MARAAKSKGTDIDELATSVTERFDEVKWKDFNASNLAKRNETRSAVIDIRQDLLKVAASDPTRAARIWDEHVPSFVPRPDELPVRAPAPLDLNTIEPGRRRRRTSSEPFVEPGQALGATDKPKPNAERDGEQASEPRRGEPSSAKRDEGDPRTERTRFLLEGLGRQYHQVDDKYHFRDRGGDVAFEAQERKLVTQHETPAVVSSMLDLAEARGWSSLKLSGTEEFRREAWLQASVRGLETSGYRPDKLDKARLAELQKARAVAAPTNSISEGRRGPTRETDWKSRFDPVVEDGKPEPNVPLTQGQDQFLRVMEATMRHRGDSPAAIAKARELANEKLTSERVYVGTLVEVGTAPYRYKSGGKASHFVTLEDDKGDRSKVWGVDLPRALQSCGAEPGQKLAVVFRGQKPVEVDVGVRDGKGVAVRTERQIALRNTWEIVQFDRLRDEAKASVTKAVERQVNPAELKVFDRSASAVTIEPQPARPGPRSREQTR